MLSQGYREIITERERREAAALLLEQGLDMPEGVTSGLGCYEDGRLIATAFLAGNVVCGICVAPAHRGEGLAEALTGRLVSAALDAGASRLCIFTKPEEADKFLSLGFRRVAAAERAALLEYGSPSFADWLDATRKTLDAALAGLAGLAPLAPSNAPSEVSLGAIVMNANPFTLGHRALVEAALIRRPRTAVFVVEEDASSFPFADRFSLVQKGLTDLPGAIVLPSGPYMVSRSSFPAYFTGKADHAAVHAALDATIFATLIAPGLGIGTRFIGSEPYCEVTSMYNQTLQTVLPRHKVVCVEIQRREAQGKAISASTVRDIMRNMDYRGYPEQLLSLVPPTTAAFLLSDAGERLAATLRGGVTRH